MDRNYRLTSPADFKRVRRDGQSFAHPLIVLLACPNGLARSRFGVTSSHSLGNTTDRNRAKRRLRHAIRPHLEDVEPGWDFVFIARPAILTAPWDRLQQAVRQLLERSEAADRRMEHGDE